MHRLRIEITQTNPKSDPQKVMVDLRDYEGYKAKKQLPFDAVLTLNAVLKLLEIKKFSETWFNPEEIDWLLENQLVFHYGGSFYHAPDRHKKIGRLLFQALFEADEDDVSLLPKLNQILQQAQDDNQKLHLEIRFDFKSRLVGAHPWELLHNGEAFLCAEGFCNLSRYIVFENPPPRRKVTEGLKVLLVTPRPNDLPQLSPEAEGEVIQQALGFLSKDKQLIIEKLEPPTFPSLRQYISQHSSDLPHILHFDGHGTFGRLCPSCKRQVIISPTATNCIRETCNHPLTGVEPQGYLAFENAQGASEYISAQRFTQLIRQASTSGKQRQADGLSLVVLSACKSAVALQGESVFNGIAQRLVNARVPAVVAMQFKIDEEAAEQFMAEFYRRITKNDSLASAVSWGWTNLDLEGDQWYRPVLYLRGMDDEGGKLFEIDQEITSRESDDYKPKGTLQINIDEILGLSEKFSPGHGRSDIIAVDQHGVIKDFIRMLVPIWRQDIDWHILYLQAPVGTGKTLAINRFEFICNLLRAQIPLLFHRIDFEGQPLLPRQIAVNIVDGLSNLARGDERLRLLVDQNLKQLQAEITPTLQRTSQQTSLHDPYELGRLLYTQLELISEQAMIVLLFDNFHILHEREGGSWLVTNFLTRVRDGTSNIAISLTSDHSPENQDLEISRWYGLKRHTAISDLMIEDVQRLAEKAFRIDQLSRDEAMVWIDNARSMSTYLDMRLMMMQMQVAKRRDTQYREVGG